MESQQPKAVNLDLTLPDFKPLATMLLVEDDDDVVYLLQQLLHREGFVIHTARNGRDAKAFIAGSKPTDMVLTDLMLPYFSGFDVITQIREDQRWKNVPVIVLSGKANGHDTVRALDLGADDCVMKPYNPEELIARIRRHLRLRDRA